MTYAGGTRNRRKLDKKGGLIKTTADAKAYSVGDYVWVFQEVVPPKGTKKLLKKWRGPFQITEELNTKTSNHTMPRQRTGASQRTCKRETI